MDVIGLVLVFILGLVSAFIGVNVGSGGLIVIPVLMFLGLPPKMAIATMRVGSLGSSAGGIYKFHVGKKTDYKIAFPATIITLIGAFFGANFLLEVPDEILEKLIGILILLVLFFVVFSKTAGLKKHEGKSKLSKALGYLLFLPLGFWGGFFGGGTGTFMAYVLIFLFGQTFLESAGTRKIPILAYNVLSLVVFSLFGLVDWLLGVVLLVGMLIGSYVGAAYGMKKGEGWVRTLFILMMAASAIKLILF